MTEPFDLGSRNLVQGLTLMISWTRVMVKVIGQRSRLPGQKTWFHGFCDLSEQMLNPGLWCDVVTSYAVMALCCHMTSRNDVTVSRLREVQQHFSVFWSCPNRLWGSAIQRRAQFLLKWLSGNSEYSQVIKSLMYYERYKYNYLCSI